MCGIAGFHRVEPAPLAESERIASVMALAIAHRGPDNSGALSADQGRLGLGFRRLAIIDLSAEGRQPMTSVSGRYIIVFNGEIYNYRAIRDALTREGRAPSWRGSSDTEVLLAAIEAYGLEAALKSVNGMFALALWDIGERTLSLARDRFGEKPLYYGWNGAALLFGSELKALCAYPGFNDEIDRRALAEFMRLGYVPAPQSIFRGIGKLQPASFVVFDEKARAARAMPAPVSYWSAIETAHRSMSAPFQGSDNEAVEVLDVALRKAVGLRTFADVPVGAFLSGGIDSSVVVAIMQALAICPILTFTIGNSDSEYDESSHAAAMARHLGTRHETLMVSSLDALAIIPSLGACYCEPFADSSQIPTILVAKMARRQVTVALSGDGGDELFGGYNRHVWTRRAAGAGASLPRPMRATLSRVVAATSPAMLEALLRPLRALAPRTLRRRMDPVYLQTFGGAMAGERAENVRDALVSVWPSSAVPVIREEVEDRIGDSGARLETTTGALFRDIMALDTVSYLPDDILTKVDRATMGESLEARAPFLDPDLFAFAWSLPDRLLINGGRGKIALRRVLSRYAPSEMFERPKQGFAIPIADWLRGDLADWAQALLDPKALARDGFLDARAIGALWRTHASGAKDCTRQLWHALMFQSWLEERSKPAGDTHANTDPSRAPYPQHAESA